MSDDKNPVCVCGYCVECLLADKSEDKAVKRIRITQLSIENQILRHQLTDKDERIKTLSEYRDGMENTLQAIADILGVEAGDVEGLLVKVEALKGKEVQGE